MAQYTEGDFVLFNPAMKPSLHQVDHPMVVTRVAQVWWIASRQAELQYYDVEWYTINGKKETANLPEHFLITDMERSRKTKIGNFLKDE
jgi:hypothetical protein